MNRLRNTLLLGAMVGVVGFQPATEAYVFGTGDFNTTFFRDFEVIYRSADQCAALGGCIDDPTVAGPNNPLGWSRIALGAGNPLVAGDVISGVFQAQNNDFQGGTIWNFAPDDQLEGYFAQEILAIQGGDDGVGAAPGGHEPNPFANGATEHIVLGNPTTDPWGILDTTMDEMFRIYTDLGATALNTDADIMTTLGVVTDGNLFVSLSTLDDHVANPDVGLTDGYAYSHIDVGLALADFSDQEAFLALNTVVNDSGIFMFDGINDPNEGELGNVFLGYVEKLGDAVGNEDGVCDAGEGCDPVFGAPTLFTEFYATAELDLWRDADILGPAFAGPEVLGDGIGNDDGICDFGEACASPYLGDGSSPWHVNSNDPIEFVPVAGIPEPGTLVLMGMGLLGLAGMARRRLG